MTGCQMLYVSAMGITTLLTWQTFCVPVIVSFLLDISPSIQNKRQQDSHLFSLMIKLKILIYQRSCKTIHSVSLSDQLHLIFKTGLTYFHQQKRDLCILTSNTTMKILCENVNNTQRASFIQLLPG